MRSMSEGLVVPDPVGALALLAPQIAARRLSLVLAVPGDDVHVVANALAERVLTAAGYAVTNLGVLVPEAELLATAHAMRPTAIVLSSLNGHALVNCGALPRRLAAAGLATPVYLGGNLTVGGVDPAQLQRTFAPLGFARVFPPEVDLLTGAAEISHELLTAAASGRLGVGGAAA
jgi:methylaspartate mutase sigma subunit